MTGPRDDAGSRLRPRARGTAEFARLHQRFGWWSLLGFLALGAALETMHGFKVGWYLDVSNETRRLMWTLSHAHGTLFALVHIVFAQALRDLPPASPRWLRLASPSLLGSSVLLPGGFLLGGVVIYSGDPGVGILLVPLGALLILFAVFLAARHLGTTGTVD